MKKYPKIHLPSKANKSERYYEDKTYWYVQDLWEASEDLEIFEIPLMAINMSCSRYLADSIHDLAWQMKRVINTDLSYPILLTPDGSICDGVHRVTKATYLGKTTIKAKRFKNMPQSFKDEDE